MFHYYSFGLHIASEIEVPLLRSIDNCENPDVIVRCGDLSNYPDRCVSEKEIFHRRESCNVLVRNGNEIIVDMEATLPIGFLSPICMGDILQQRGLFLLHGVAICKNGLAIVLCGNHGSGKSTLAMEFIRNGWKLLTDDIVAIEKDGGAIKVRSGNPVLKMWCDSISDYNLEGKVIRSVESISGKHYIDAKSFFCEKDRNIDLIVFLKNDQESSGTKELTGADKLIALESSMLHNIKGKASSISFGMDLANNTRGFEITRGEKPFSVKEEYNRIIQFSHDFVIKIANSKVLVKPYSEKVKPVFSNYLSSGKSDFEIEVTKEKIYNEQNRITETIETVYANPLVAAERFVVFRSLAEGLPFYQSLLIHGSAIAFKGNGLVFTAASGTGKSTYAYSWSNCFPEEVEYINDDKPFVSVVSGKGFVSGSPWMGKHGRGCNKTVPLRAICFLERSEINTIKRITPIDALSLLFANIYTPEKEKNKKALFSLVSQLSSVVDFYIIGCNQDKDACITAKEVMFDE